MGAKMTSGHAAWVLRGHYKTHNPNPEQPIKFQYKKRRKGSVQPQVEVRAAAPRSRSRSRSASEPELHGLAGRQQRIDTCLASASLEQPANVPVVLALATVLYQTRAGGYQAELAVPLGMVVNAVFRKQRWLYVQTPHGDEGYVAAADCIPLGIVPRADADAARPAPCWETSTDVFPRPSGNRSDVEAAGSERGARRRRRTDAAAVERSVDRMYLRVARGRLALRRDTLLVVAADYAARAPHTLSVAKGDVVVLLAAHTPGWFAVRRHDGAEGYIPAGVVGHGFL